MWMKIQTLHISDIDIQTVFTIFLRKRCRTGTWRCLNS
jgi:hypothetical protein